MVHFYSRIICLIGFILGIFLAITYKQYSKVIKQINSNEEVFKRISYPKWFSKEGLKRKLVSWDSIRYTDKQYLLESQYLYERINVLCVIFVKNIKNLEASNDTWARGCNSIKTIHLNGKSKPFPVKRTKDNSSWVLLCNILFEISDKYMWTVIVHDYTFVIMENLRYYLAALNADKKYYLGHVVKFWNTVYNSGQAGYVLSRGTLQTFKKLFHKDQCSNGNYWNREDFYLGKHLSALNITPVDTRDSKGLSTFHPYNWYHAFYPGENYYKMSVYPTTCCSERSIAFQAIEGDKMYTYYYLLYTLQIFREGTFGNRLPATTEDDDKVWKQFLRERNIHNDITSDQYYKLWEDLIDDPNSFASKMKKEEHVDYV